MLLVIAVYCVLNLVIQSLIQPRFVGDSVGLAMTTTFVALVFWAWLLGPLGALLAIPLTLLVKALLVDVDPTARWAIALAGSLEKPAHAPSGPPPATRRRRASRPPTRQPRKRAARDACGAIPGASRLLGPRHAGQRRPLALPALGHLHGPEHDLRDHTDGEQADEHLGRDEDTRQLGDGGDVPEADRREDGHREVQPVGPAQRLR